jgi:LuxR family transcriptional regulator
MSMTSGRITRASWTEFGFDRLFYAFNAFRGAGLYDNPEDALLLTNMPSDYVEAYVGGGMFRDGVMLRWAVQNTGAASWRDVYEGCCRSR